ncbi:zinc finger BED domain-containing protein RICESLEEPER 2 [Artemisia annua]|uniref:Zinc finger BED domain-containing protein RICESLEEPER 2 n=1 Tax=Artemisia annua TaxID=35608 RepID=A0A2U1KRS8_ARTAN|nr:zinc finger BED domain-containing protein RICESLEEPER 2 [Artemisia annua]
MILILNYLVTFYLQYAPESHIEAEVSNKKDELVIDLDSEQVTETPIDEHAVETDKKNGGRRSWVWDHFTFVKGETQVPCPYCKTVLAAGTKRNGTSTLIQHLKNVCKKSPVYKKSDLKNQATLSFKPVTMGEPSGGLASHTFSQAKCKKSLARMCIIDNRPFSVVDDQGLQEFVWDLNPILQVIDPNYRSYFQNEVEDDGFFMEYLKIFFNVTKKVSGSKYVTSSLFFGELVTMHATISRMCLQVDEKKRKMALSMKDKYDKYWDNIDNMNFLLHVALVLDPRNKLRYLEYCLGLIYGMKSNKSEEVLERVVSTLTDLYNHYKMKLGKANDRKTTTSSSSTSFFDNGYEVDLDDGYERYLEECGEGVNNTEVEIYLADCQRKRTWWKNWRIWKLICLLKQKSHATKLLWMKTGTKVSLVKDIFGQLAACYCNKLAA